jgi:hypothetical protein
MTPVPVAALSKAYVCGRSPAEIVGSNLSWIGWCLMVKLKKKTVHHLIFVFVF